MKTTHTATIRKGETVPAAWFLRQSRPHPDITAECGRLEWRNAGTLLPRYGTPAHALPRIYSAYLLPSPESDLPADWNRTHLAGFDDNPAPLAVRGVPLGEVTAELSPWPVHMGGGYRVSYKVRGFGDPTPGESKWFAEQVTPHLVAAVEDHADALHAEAVAGLKTHLAERITRARAEIDTLEKQAAEMLAIA
jgi:hypothetical protein